MSLNGAESTVWKLVSLQNKITSNTISYSVALSLENKNMECIKFDCDIKDLYDLYSTLKEIDEHCNNLSNGIK